MKKNILLTVFILLVSTGLVSQERSMAVMTFNVVGNAVTADELENFMEIYILTLASYGKMKITDRIKFNKIMKEMNFEFSDLSDSSKTANLGKAINANLISSGKIMKLGGDFTVFVSVVDTMTAETIASVEHTFYRIRDLLNRTGIREIVDDIITKLVYFGSFYEDAGEGGGIVFYYRGLQEVVFLDRTVHRSNARDQASAYRGGGYDNWRIPTHDEAITIFEQIVKLKRCPSYVMESKSLMGVTVSDGGYFIKNDSFNDDRYRNGLWYVNYHYDKYGNPAFEIKYPELVYQFDQRICLVRYLTDE